MEIKPPRPQNAAQLRALFEKSVSSFRTYDEPAAYFSDLLRAHLQNTTRNEERGMLCLQLTLPERAGDPENHQLSWILSTSLGF